MTAAKPCATCGIPEADHPGFLKIGPCDEYREHPAAKLSLLDRFRQWRYYRREYRLAHQRGQMDYMPPPWRRGL